MKKIICLIFLVIINSCTNEVEIERLKYSKEDLKPLNDSTKKLYYKDAAYIEFGEVIKDSANKATQIELNENAIQSYYEDLLSVYNNSYKLSNTFFEYASSLYSCWALTLYQITVGFSSNKSWSGNWKNGIKHTGEIKIDSLIDNYNLDITFMFESDSIYWCEIKSQTPINYFALIEKFKGTSEFLFVEPSVLIGCGSFISFKTENNYKYYKYNYGWGDCPSGCTEYHYWIVRLEEEEIVLVEEGGSSLN